MNVTGAISELAAGSAVARKAVRSAGGIEQLIKLLASTDEVLLVNVTKAVGSCAGDKDSMAAISSSVETPAYSEASERLDRRSLIGLLIFCSLAVAGAVLCH